VKWDVRKAFPYSSMTILILRCPSVHGDTTIGTRRLEEMRQSQRIIRQALDGLPEGPIIAKMPKVIKPPAGEVHSSVESPKGELGMYLVSDGSTRPYRLRCRPPCFVNLQSLRQMSIGHLVADVCAIIGSIDIVLGEVDR
jgi:NADH-quinone oxidoreductase subunit D